MIRPLAVLRVFAAVVLAAALAGCIPIGFRSSTQMVALDRVADTAAGAAWGADRRP